MKPKEPINWAEIRKTAKPLKIDPSKLKRVNDNSVSIKWLKIAKVTHFYGAEMLKLILDNKISWHDFNQLYKAIEYISDEKDLRIAIAMRYAQDGSKNGVNFKNYADNIIKKLERLNG